MLKLLHMARGKHSFFLDLDSLQNLQIMGSTILFHLASDLNKLLKAHILEHALVLIQEVPESPATYKTGSMGKQMCDEQSGDVLG